jgi:hypothetical protein
MSRDDVLTDLLVFNLLSELTSIQNNACISPQHVCQSKSLNFPKLINFSRSLVSHNNFAQVLLIMNYYSNLSSRVQHSLAHTMMNLFLINLNSPL